MKLTQTAKSSLLLTLVTGLVLLPTLAVCPQSGDAAEIVLNALRGGVPHPPGFPLQAWLDRLFIHLPLESAAQRISAFSLTGHLCLAFFLCETLRKLSCSWWPRFLGTFAAVLFPTVWYLGVRPEVYAWANAWIAILIYQAVCLSELPPKRERWWEAVLLGGAVALAGAQHTVTVVAFPAFCVSAYQLLKPPEDRPRCFAAMAIPFLILFVGLYGSLVLLGANAVWPNWGPPQGVTGIARHLLRADFGVFAFGSSMNDSAVSGLRVLCGDLWLHWNVAILLLVPGAYFLSFRKNVSLASAIAIFGTLAVALGMNLQAQGAGERGVAEGFLEKLQGPVIVPLSLLMGLGLQQLKGRFRRKVGDFSLSMLAVAIVGAMAIHGWNYAGGGQRRTLDLFREAIALELPTDALYVSAGDFENFYGIPSAQGIRFPVENGMVKQPWYTRRVLPRIEPRLASDSPHDSVLSLVDLAYRQGWTIASTDPRLLWISDRTAQMRGVLFVQSDSLRDPLSEETVRAAVRLCPITSRLEALPPEAHSFERLIYAYFARAYLGAASYLKEKGNNAGATVPTMIAAALKEGTDAAAWRGLCQKMRGGS